MTDKEFEAFLTKCQQEVRAKQTILNEAYELNTYETYTFNKNHKTLELKKNDNEVLKFEVACIGSWGQEDESWVWAWSNDHFAEEIKSETLVLKDLAKETGYNVFEQGGFKCEEIVARDLAFIGVCKLNAKGIYRITTEEGYLFLAIKEVIK